MLVRVFKVRHFIACGREKRMGTGADALRGNEDVTVDFVGWVYVMGIARRHDGFSGDAGGLDDIAKQHDETLFGGDAAHIDEVGIVLKWLNLHEIIEGDDLHQVLAVAGHGSVKDFAIEASRAKEKVLAVAI